MNQTTIGVEKGLLIKIKLGEVPANELAKQSFNNDFYNDVIINSFRKLIPILKDRLGSVPTEFLYENKNDGRGTNDIYKYADGVVIGQYCDNGLVVPKDYNIVFKQLFNCPPLISLIQGDEEYISFLHVAALRNNSEIVDMQVKHWMKTISKLGYIKETVFAPRKGVNDVCDTKYETSIEDITKFSQKTIVLERYIDEIKGVVNQNGVYFNGCGYHLWQR